jgi:hypothetical protein
LNEPESRKDPEDRQEREDLEEREDPKDREHTRCTYRGRSAFSASWSSASIAAVVGVAGTFVREKVFI